MRSLRSNFLLDGSSLGITIEKPFEVLIKNKDLINDESNGVEPFENSENTTKDGCESMQKTIWWARRESSLRSAMNFSNSSTEPRGFSYPSHLHKKYAP